MPTEPPGLESRILGCLLGGALGDALGAYFEGQPAPAVSTKAPPADTAYAALLPADLRVTDDTQLTLATCEAIMAAGTVSPEAIAERFVDWFRQRRLTGLGASTLKALVELQAGGHWATAGATGERAAGNGAAMRVAPLAFLLNPDSDVDRQTIRDVCRITHRHDEAYLGALAIVRAIRLVTAGHAVDVSLLTTIASRLPDSCIRDRLREVGQSPPSLAEYARRYSSAGYVVDSVPLALLAATNSYPILDAIWQIADCGGDTDTVAALCGQILGAARGAEALPAPFLERIDATGLVRRAAAELYRLAVLAQPSPAVR